MSALCALPPPQLSSHMPASFKGEGDMLVDRLIVASRKPGITDAQLKERALVPFQFDADLPLPIKALEPSAARQKRSNSKPQAIPAHHGQKRSGSQLAGTSPPKKENERQQGKHQRKPASPTSSTANAAAATMQQQAAGGRKHRRDPSAKSLPQLASGASSSNQQQPHKRVVTVATAASTPPVKPSGRGSPKDNSANTSSGGTPTAAAMPPPPAPAPSATLAFAGPSFTNSPTPDSLPIPTSSLLMAQAADHLRATLQL